MRARYASFALAFLVAVGVAVAVATAVRSGTGSQPARYDNNQLDATGAVATAGSWAILNADARVLTTWEDLRSSAATLRLHQNDASGTSQAAAYDEIAEGDLVELRKADDCWVRYLVTGTPARPASGSSRWEFPVEWMTYAATGAYCSGVAWASGTLTVDWDPPAIRASEIASPVRHGPWVLPPPGWTGPLEPAIGISRTPPQEPTALAVVRQHSFWREPVLPTGWTLRSAALGFEGIDGYWASYLDSKGGRGADVYVFRPRQHPSRIIAPWGGTFTWETRVIDGRPALVYYEPSGARTLPPRRRIISSSYHNTKALIFDRKREIMYFVDGASFEVLGPPDAVILIARSLYRAIPQ